MSEVEKKTLGESIQEEIKAILDRTRLRRTTKGGVSLNELLRQNKQANKDILYLISYASYISEKLKESTKPPID